MKRITVILALLAAIALPVAVWAADRPIQSARIGVSGSAQYGGVGYDTVTLPFASPRSGSQSLADDLDVGVSFDVDTAPIMACSGLDIRDTLKGMFDLGSLADDVKSYLGSLLAKQALSLVYANPAIAGVLDGLKAFGNARFQLAQTSCEAIEAEVSAESRYIRQQAFEKCLETKSTYDCSVETGNYIGTDSKPGIIKELVQSAEYRINNSVHGWASRIRFGGTDFRTRACANLKGYCDDPSSQAQAEQGLAATPNVGRDKDGNLKVDKPDVVEQQVFDSGYNQALPAAAIFAGSHVAVAGAMDGDITAAVKVIRTLQAERKAEYARYNGKFPLNAGEKYFDRQRGATMFITAERERTAVMALDLARRFGARAWQHPDIDHDHQTLEPGAGVVGTHTGGSSHDDGLAADLYNGDLPGLFQAAIAECERGIGCSQVIYGNQQWRRGRGLIAWTGGGHDDHVHFAMAGSGQELNVKGPIASAIASIQELKEAIAPAADADTEEAKLDIFRQALRPVPLVVEDACYYDLLKDKHLHDIRNTTNTFGLGVAVNRMVDTKKGKTPEPEPESGSGSRGADLASSTTAKIQEINRTIGRLAVCYMVTSWETANVMKTQFLTPSSSQDYLSALSLATAGQAGLTFYDALIYQISMSKLMAVSNPEAPANISSAFDVALEMLKNSRDALKGYLERQEVLAARQRKLDEVLQQNADEAARDAAVRSRGRNSDFGSGFVGFE